MGGVLKMGGKVRFLIEKEKEKQIKSIFIRKKKKKKRNRTFLLNNSFTIHCWTWEVFGFLGWDRRKMTPFIFILFFYIYLFIFF